MSQPTGGSLPAIPGQISMTNEIRRKLIHLSSISIPVMCWFLSREEALWILVPMTLAAVVIEILRRTFPRFEQVFRSFFGPLLRPHESGSPGSRPEINGATFVLVSATLCVFLFPKIIAVTAFAVLIVSDTASALYGRRFGKHKFLRKSVEGSSAFFVTAMAVVLLMAYIASAPWEFVAVGAVAALAAMVMEAVTQGGSSIDDNLTIPTTFGGVMWGLFALLNSPEITALLDRL